MSQAQAGVDDAIARMAAKRNSCFFMVSIVFSVIIPFNRHIKKRGNNFIAYPANRGLRIAFDYRINNAEAHTDGIQ